MIEKINSQEVKSLLAAMDDLIEIKALIRKVVPNYNLDEELKSRYLFLLEALRSKLQPLFSKYLHQDDKLQPIKTRENLINEIKNISGKANSFLVSASSSKKKLKNIGIDPRNIIVSGGPLFVEDFKKISPDIPDNALSDIKKKCDNLLNIIKRENQLNKELVFLVEIENPTDKIILEEIEEISKSMTKKIKVFKIDSWKILES